MLTVAHLARSLPLHGSVVLESEMRKVLITITLLLVSVFGSAQERPSSTETFRVTIHVNAGRTRGKLCPVWRFFGGDEPNYAYMKDGKKLLGELGELRPHAIYFRTHNLLTTGDGTPALKWGSTNA